MGITRNRIVLSVILLIFGAASAYFYLSSAQDAGPVAPYRRQAPDFELTDSQGKTRRLEEWKGNAVVLHFWASWCPPCLDEIPHWLAGAKKQKDRRVKFVAISLDGSWADAEKVFPQANLPENVISLIDVTGKIPEKYGSYQFPETYLLNPDHKVVMKWVGPQDWGAPIIDTLLGRVAGVTTGN